MTDKLNNSEKVMLVTGGTGGIGKATATGLAKQGATVIAVGRNRERGEAAVEEIKAASGNPRVEMMLADLSSQADVVQLTEEFKARYNRLHVLVNNAGALSAERRETEDGIELNLAVNHLAPFLLTRLLLPVLEAASHETSSSSRVVNVTSGAHRFAKLDLEDLQSEEKPYSPMKAYSQSKLAGVVTTYEFARRLSADGARVTANVADPGGADTEMSRSIARDATDVPLWVRLTEPLVKLMKTSTEEAAYSSTYLASSPETEGVTGRYFSRKGKPVRSSKASYDAAAAKRLWKISEQLTGLSEEPGVERSPRREEIA